MRFSGATLFDGNTLKSGCTLQVSESGIVDAIIEDAADSRADSTTVTTITEDTATNSVSSSANIELPGGYLCPGFVDLQVNGGGGVLFNDDLTVSGLRTMAEAHLSLGTTSFLPTLITDHPDSAVKAADAVVSAITAAVPAIAGLHLEGPHISVAKKGAHPPQHIREMTEADIKHLIDARKRLPVLKVTVAPENVSSLQIEQLNKSGVLVSLGHSDAGYEHCRTAFDAGARCVTHLFNAMSQLGSREPGLVGAALDNAAVGCGLIVDGHHVEYAAVRLAARVKSPEQMLYLVSDAMTVAGSDLTHFNLQGRTVMRQHGRLTLQDGTLAGADLSLAEALVNITNYGNVDLASALAMLTSVPARVADIPAGRLAKGLPANLVWLDDSYRLQRIWYRGKELPRKASN